MSRAENFPLRNPISLTHIRLLLLHPPAGALPEASQNSETSSCSSGSSLLPNGAVSVTPLLLLHQPPDTSFFSTGFLLFLHHLCFVSLSQVDGGNHLGKQELVNAKLCVMGEDLELTFW